MTDTVDSHHASPGNPGVIGSFKTLQQKRNLILEEMSLNPKRYEKISQRSKRKFNINKEFADKF